jgi:hypothetical protein
VRSTLRRRQRLRHSSSQPKIISKARDPVAARSDFFNISTVESRSSFLPYFKWEKTLRCVTSLGQERKMAQLPQLNSKEKVAAFLVAAMSLIPLVPYALGQ